MKRTCYAAVRALLLLCLLLSLAVPAFADGIVQTEPLAYTDGRFTPGDGVRGYFLTAVPGAEEALLCLDGRTLRAGDAIPAEALSRLQLIPAGDGAAELCFLPVGAEGPLPAAVLTMHVRTEKNAPPRALELSLETYRNIPNTGVLRALDPEGGALTFQLASKPKRGTVDLAPDGSFTYTPKRNKVGEDSFTFVAVDEAGNFSEPGTVRIRILKPTEAETFADLALTEQAPALWLRETGLFGGELLNGTLSFGPEKPVSRGEFLTMVMAMEGIDPEIGLQSSGFADEQDAPLWMRPYLASALRRGLIRGRHSDAGLVFRPDAPVTASEAAEILARALALELPVAAAASPEGGGDAACAALNAAGISWSGGSRSVTRMETARLLWAAASREEAEASRG